MDFDEAIRELKGLEGKTVLLQLTPADPGGWRFEMLDGINEVWQSDDDAEVFYVNFVDAEAGLKLRRSKFAAAGWEESPTNDFDRRFRIRIGNLDARFT